MKVILHQDVASIGKKFTVVDVPNGYALNKLIPTGKAAPATEQNLQALESRKAKLTASSVAVDEQFTNALTELSAKPLEVVVEANEQGQLFQAVHAAQVIEAAEQRGVTIPADMITIPETIKSVGDHTVTLAAGDKTESLTISVVTA